MGRKHQPIGLGKEPERLVEFEEVGNALADERGLRLMPATEPRARARETEKLHNELLEEKPHERLDTRTPSAAVGADPHLAAVGEIRRTEDAAR